MDRVVFACVHNAGRSQMAAAFLSAMADPARVDAVSAGTRPAERLYPEVIDAMREIGIDLEAKQPQRLTEPLVRNATLLVTMGCGDECPYIPGKRYLDWDLEDPKGRPVDEVRATREEIDRRVRELVEELDS